MTVERRDARLWGCVRDDGVGGADPACGSGLVGLKDRIEAFGGTMTLDSPSGRGTTLVAQLPATSRPSDFPASRLAVIVRLALAAASDSGFRYWRRWCSHSGSNLA